MAIQNLNKQDQLDITMNWDGSTGQQVEDFISRNIPVEIKYDNSNLSLINKSGDIIVSGKVSVETPKYKQGVLILGIRINNKIYTNNPNLLTQYNADTKIELAVATYSIAQYSSGIVDSIGAVSTTITFGTQKKIIQVDPIKYELCTVESDQLISVNLSQSEWKWFDITDLFKISQTSQKITASVENSQSVFNTLITNQVISLQYKGQYIVNNNNVSFTLIGGTSSNYHLEGYNGTNKITTNSGIMNFSQLQPGLNQLSIKAVHNDTTSNISTDYIYLNIIYTKNFSDTAVAINEVSKSVNNNDTSKIYQLDAYSLNKDTININTYLEDNLPNESAPQPTQLLESISLTAQDYNNNIYSTSYYKYIEINSDNASKYLVVKVNDSWYTFYNVDAGFLNANLSQELQVPAVNTNFTFTETPYLNYDQIIGRSTTLFSKNNWVNESNRTIYRVEAGSEKVFESPLNLSLGNNFSLEFGLKTYNVSNEQESVIDIGPIQIRPTTICWNTSDTNLYNARNSQFQEGVDTHIMITVHPKYRIDSSDPYYPNYLPETSQQIFDNYQGTINLVRIYINGVIDREISISDSELKTLQSADLQIQPTTADLDLYLLRVYNDKSLDFDEIQHNYLSFLKTYTEKELFYTKNDILNNEGAISFQKTLGKYNSLVYVFPKGGKFPNRSWVGEDNTSGDQDKLAKTLPVTLFINYKDIDINLKYGGRITKGLVKGQGSSAMRYLIWNVAYWLNKMKSGKSIFTPYSELNTETNKFKEHPSTIEGYYNMPPYDGQKDSSESSLKVKKLVGKVNVASSMQSHKEGACKLFNDAYKNSVASNLISGGRKAVQEETFLYFYIETDLESVDNIELSDILDRTDIKFMGVQTWGSAKGDNATFGYGDNTPEYLLMEGGENTDPHVQFRRPWQSLQRGTGILGEATYKLANYPTVTSEESKEEPWKNLWIKDESITYDGNRGAWDIDYGVEELTNTNGNSYYQITDSVKPSFKKFREFVDFVYSHDYNLIATSETDTSVWDQNRKYVVTASTFANFPSHKRGDIYRYDDINSQWVAAGTEYNNGWSRLNLFELVSTTSTQVNAAINRLKGLFTEGIKEYVDKADVAYHQAFIRFLSGTDNRAKNTYFQIIGKLYEPDSEGHYQVSNKGDYKIRLMGDDLDTIIITDNNGLQSKAYNLLEPSYEPSTANQWGDGGLNSFFYMFDQTYEEDIKTYLKEIIKYAFQQSNTQANTANYFYKVFYSIQKDKIPAVAYNHFAKIYYEAAQQILNSKAISAYKNNGIQPIEQSHGSCVEGEMHFMKKRYAFLSSYAQQNMGNVELNTASSAGSGNTLTLRIAFTPFQDFYPNYMYELNTFYYYGELNTNSQFNIIKYKAEANKDYVINIKKQGTAINQGLLMLSCFKKLDITGLTQSDFISTFDRVTNFTIDNTNVDKYNDLFGKDYPKLNISLFTASFPVVEELNLKNVPLPDILDLSKCTKLKTLNLSNSTVKRVILPANVQNLVLPASIETFELYNPVKNITLEGLSNLKVVDLDNVGNFNITEFCNNLLESTQLESVTLRNLNNSNISLKALKKLILLQAKLTGKITVVNSNNDLESISYTDKINLVNLYGNIDSEANSLYINYKETTAYSISCETEISVYGEGYSGNPFGLSLDGNNVALITEGGKVIPDITYRFTRDVSDVATINNRTGVITLKVASSPKSTTATIIVKLRDGRTLTSKDITVNFAWKAPELGNFVYADGTYSSAYMTNKTLMGLIFAIDKTNDTSGTAYIVGKEYLDSQYVGYSDEGNSEASDDRKNLYYVKYWLSQQIPGQENKYHTANGVSSQSDNDADKPIIYGTFKKKNFTNFTGKADTKAYVNNVNTILLRALIRIYPNLIQASGDTYKIATKENLDALLDSIPNISSQNLEQMQCLLFPYFYETYLYEPTVTEKERSTDVFQSQFSKGNWYVPSYPELATLIYYRGYSAAGEYFSTGDISIKSNISDSITKGQGDLENPIFSIAYKNAGNYMPTAWNTLADSNNLCTTTDTTCHNYTYQEISNWSSGSMMYSYRWVLGANEGNTGTGINAAQYKGWRLIKHKPLPCVQFKYQQK